MENIIHKVKDYIQQNALLKDNAQVVVGLSGGADSVCLAVVLHQLGYKVTAVHCNFHLRGDESVRDEHFVTALCLQFGWHCHVEHFDTQTYAQTHKMSIEMAAREQRYALFHDINRNIGAEAIAVGHHQDDNVETMLLNLTRGTGIKGLCGIQPKNGDIIRPLLCLTRQEILSFLQSEGLNYMTDHTNAEDIYARNKVRLNIMPLFESINQGALQNITSTIENLNEVYKVYQHAIQQTLSACCQHQSNGEIHIITSILQQHPSPISILHELLSPIGFNKKQLKDILSSLHNIGRIHEANGRRLLIDREKIIIEGTHYTPIHIYQELLPIEQVTIQKKTHFAYLDADKLCGNLSLRTPQEGDTFAPFGMHGKRKLLSDFLTNLKLNRFEKEQQPLLVDDREIVWVVNLRSSDLYKITPTTKNVLVLSTDL